MIPNLKPLFWSLLFSCLSLSVAAAQSTPSTFHQVAISIPGFPALQSAMVENGYPYETLVLQGVNQAAGVWAANHPKIAGRLKKLDVVLLDERLEIDDGRVILAEHLHGDGDQLTIIFYNQHATRVTLQHAGVGEYISVSAGDPPTVEEIESAFHHEMGHFVHEQLCNSHEQALWQELWELLIMLGRAPVLNVKYKDGSIKNYFEHNVKEGFAVGFQLYMDETTRAQMDPMAKDFFKDVLSNIEKRS